MRMPRLLLLILVAASTGSIAAEEDVRPRGFSSPDGRFSLVVYVPNASASEDAKLIVVERPSGKIVSDLGPHYRSIISQTFAVWSADSRQLAYRAGHHRQWSTSVLWWDGSAFQYVPLPEELPSPEISFPTGEEAAGAKNHAGGVAPVRWLPSGDLELVREETQTARESSRTCTASASITIGFDAQHRASIQSVSKSETRCNELQPLTVRRWRRASDITSSRERADEG